MENKKIIFRYFIVDLTIWILLILGVSFGEYIYNQNISIYFLNRYVICVLMTIVYLGAYLFVYGRMVTEQMRNSKLSQPKYRLISLGISLLLVVVLDYVIRYIF